MNHKWYKIINLKTGETCINRFDRSMALTLAHHLNKINPNGRYAICAA